ncbi:MAG: serine/threonine-protein kinase [Myxococcota bacterium]
MTADVTVDVSGLALPALEGLVDEVDRLRVRQQLFGGSSQPFELGRYLITGTLGQGGSGYVFKAFDPTLDRRVALKVLHKELDDKHTTRLLREAQAMAKLSHPHVVHVYEVGEVDGRSFVAMELVRGRTLKQWMQQDPRPSWRECIEVFLQVGSGLAAAHGRGLVHRDFKPSNAIIDDEGRARVLDFGLARQVGDQLSDELSIAALRASADTSKNVPLDVSLTKTGAVLGTPAYMPPEQMMGAEANARSDQFSFCVALYEAIYGERPFEGASMQALMISMTHGEVRPAPKGSRVPARLRAVLLRGMALRPEARWPSMEALLEQLRRLLICRRGRWLSLGAGIVVGLGLFGAGLSYGADMGQRRNDAHEQPHRIEDRPDVPTKAASPTLSTAPGHLDHAAPGLEGNANVDHRA